LPGGCGLPKDEAACVLIGLAGRADDPYYYGMEQRIGLRQYGKTAAPASVPPGGAGDHA
jgi:hypothetical protein